MEKNYFILDVENTSLYGQAFAVAAVVFDKNLNVIDKFELVSLAGAMQANEWVKYNVLPVLTDMPTCDTKLELRDRFFEFYMKHRETCEVWADCAYPVETNFLSDVAIDNIEGRQWLMPFPLKEIAVFVDKEIDRNIQSGQRGLRKHHPLDDCIASAACLFEKIHI